MPQKMRTADTVWNPGGGLSCLLYDLSPGASSAMVLDDDFELVHGASWWWVMRQVAERRGVAFPENGPLVSVAVIRRGFGFGPAHEAFYAGVGAVTTDASIVLFEWLTVSDLHGPKMLHRAVEHLMRAGMVYAAATGKRVVMLTAHKGVNKMAERIGLGTVQSGISVLIGG
jgi:hypothetical protein